MNFSIDSSVDQYGETGVLALGGVVSIECFHEHMARLHVALVNEEGSETSFAQGVDLGIADLRAIGRALIAAAEYMEGKNNGA